MSEPRRWAEAPADAVERDVALVAEMPARAIRLDAFDDVVARAATQPSRVTRNVLVFACSCVLGLALVWGFMPRVDVPAASPVRLSPEARWSAPSSQEIELHAGRLWMAAPTDQVLRIKTPHATIEIRNSAFLAEVTENETFLRVDEGEVMVRSKDGERRVRAGEQFAVVPAPSIPSELLERPHASDACSGDADARSACLRTEARGEALAAEVALFELGALESDRARPEAAISSWREALDRFPDGVIHPEVRIALLVELVKQRRFDEARAVAAEFERRCADDPRVKEVRAMAAGLP